MRQDILYFTQSAVLNQVIKAMIIDLPYAFLHISISSLYFLDGSVFAILEKLSFSRLTYESFELLLAEGICSEAIEV